MNFHSQVDKSDTTQLIVGGGCLVSVPIIIAAGFKYMLGYASSKEHQFAHQVEDVELEGDAAMLAEETQSLEDLVNRFARKVERVTEQYSKMGGRYSPADFEAEKARFDRLKERLAKEEKTPGLARALEDAGRKLQQFAP